MHSDKHIENIETVFKNLSSMLDVSFEIRDSKGHPTGSAVDKDDNGQLYRELFATISDSRKSHMVTDSNGETIWGIPIISNGSVQESFVVIHRKPSAIISVLDTDGNTTIARIQKTAEQAIITLVEDVLHLVSYQQESEHELDSLASELTLRYEELNFLYKIGGKAEAVSDFKNTLHYVMRKTRELLDSDYTILLIPEKNICADSWSNNETCPSVTIQEEILNATPDLLKVLSGEIDYLTDHDCVQYPFLKSFSKGFNRFLTIPMIFDGENEGIFLIAKKNSDESFTISDKRLISVVADMITIKIINAELFDNLNQFLLNLMKSFVRTIEEKDTYTHGHSERVNQNSLKIGKALGLNDQELSLLNFVSILHDIGKIGVPESILNKPGKLTEEEYAKIKEHTYKGYKILEPITQLKDYLPSILYHHERIDGTGYPEGLSGEEIPFFARIIAVADTFDAMTSDRAYRKAKRFEAVIKELLDVSGKQLDAEITHIFITKCLGIYI
jgi:HD-GYP domain-containing protein (c-di-GMP phosphodiesterase class II)